MDLTIVILFAVIALLSWGFLRLCDKVR